MELVVDTNILISALIKSGKCRELIIISDFDFYAPENLITETLNHKEGIKSRSSLDETSFNQIIGLLSSRINIIPEKEFRKFNREASKLVKHPEDTPFIALSLSRNIPLWSDDKGLKEQNKVKVYSTTELLRIYQL